MGRFLCAITLLCAAIGVAHQHCSAAIVEIDVSGRVVVNDLQGVLPAAIRTGEPWSGLIRYDTDLPDSISSPSAAFFDDIPPGAVTISVTIHGHTFVADGRGYARVINDLVHMPGDFYVDPEGDLFAMGVRLSQSPLALLDAGSIGFSWNDPTGTQLTSDGLPTHLDPLAFFPEFGGSVLPGGTLTRSIEIVGTTRSLPQASFSVDALVESAQVRIVPEPDAWRLGILGLSVTAGWRLAGVRFRRRGFCGRVRLV